MIVNERITAYLNSLERGNTKLLDSLEQDALESCVPVIRKETQAFLKFLLAAFKPQRILEIGTAVGFSALFMSEYGPLGCQVTTIENDVRRILAARGNFARAGKEGRIALLEGDAMERLKGMDGFFDFIFLDAAKGQYLSYLPELLRLLPCGGLLVSDNVLQGGEIVESRFAVERRNRTIHARMREYLYELTHCGMLTTSILPLGDGVAVSVRGGEA